MKRFLYLSLAAMMMLAAISCKKDPASTVITQCITEDATEVNFYTAVLSGVATVAKDDGEVESVSFVYANYGLREPSDAEMLKLGTKVSSSIGADGRFSVVVPIQQGTKYCYFAIAVIDGEEYLGEKAYFVTLKQSDYGETVDLGLNVKWRSCNLGATTTEEFGDYYAWGETAPKNNYTWENYTGDIDNKTGFADNNYEEDAARQALGGKWRIPTNDEWWELRNKCNYCWTSDYNGTGVSGYVFSANNGNSIFLPAAGYRYGADLNNAGSIGYYWYSKPDTKTSYVWYVQFENTGAESYYTERSTGQSIRPVWEE